MRRYNDYRFTKKERVAIVGWLLLCLQTVALPANSEEEIDSSSAIQPVLQETNPTGASVQVYESATVKKDTIIHTPSVVIPKGTRFVVTINDALDSTSTHSGEWRVGTTECDLDIDGYRLPKASTFVVEVVSVKRARRFFGWPARISLKFRELELPNGRRVSVAASVDKAKTRLIGGAPGSRQNKLSSNAKRGFAAGAVAGLGAAPMVAIAGSCVLTPAGGLALAALTPVATGLFGGLVGALFTKGEELVIGPGAQMEVVLDHPVKLQTDDPTALTEIVPFGGD